MTRSKNKLLAYPIVIDPLVEVLEVKIGLGECTQWQQLQRWQIDPIDCPSIADNINAAHVFGDAVSMKLGKYALAYNVHGILQGLWTSSIKRGWTSSLISSEINGRTQKLPSIRHTFQDHKTQQQYIRLLNEILNFVQIGGTPPRKSVMQLLECLIAPPTEMVVFEVGDSVVKVSAQSLPIDS